ncbi:hypothetical protein EVAR_32178_1 [Eumeta japonica]|uniref:Uncharacterized protein n=1 Tax=Eumeta variegata TaxID=151549 RepID=A0A4C1VZ68_EUMVA|nr:hypothetical protein EVAR_32178_1 [Eumeta japonica]
MGQFIRFELELEPQTKSRAKPKSGSDRAEIKNEEPGRNRDGRGVISYKSGAASGYKEKRQGIWNALEGIIAGAARAGRGPVDELFITLRSVVAYSPTGLR